MASPWGLQSAQIVWFLAAQNTLRAESLYLSLTGSEPETTQAQNTPIGKISTASGVVGGASRLVQIQPARIDYVITPTPGGTPIDVPIVTEFVSHIDAAISAASKVALMLNDVSRMALVGKLTRRMNNMASASSEILKLVGAKGVGEGATEVAFQLNMVKELAEPKNIALNRLVRWAAEQYTVLQVRMQDLSQAPVSTISPALVACSVSVDLNTVDKGKLLSSDDQIAIFKEMREELVRIANDPRPEVL